MVNARPITGSSALFYEVIVYDIEYDVSRVVFCDVPHSINHIT
jgi:hypothetical protein